MENKTIDQSFSNNGRYLQLRSKEVSEVMGNIPAWISSWGAFLICLFFSISIFFIVNISSVQNIKGKAIVEWQETDVLIKKKKKYFLQIMLSNNDYKKIRKRQQATFFLIEENNCLNNLNGSKLSITDVKTYRDSCLIKIPLSPDFIDKIKSCDQSSTHLAIDCRLNVNIPIFKTLMGL